MRYLNPFRYLGYTTYIAANSFLMKAILKHPRKDPERGIFDDLDNSLVFLPLLRDLFPNEPITTEDFLFTCHKEHIRKYRHLILRFIGPHSVENQGREIQTIIESTFDFCLDKKAEIEINATEFALVLTVAIVSRLILGHPGPFEKYRDITYAIDFVNKFMMKKALKIPSSAEEKITYQKSLSMIRSAIEISMTSKERSSFGSFVDILREEKHMTETQIKLALYTMYFAGSDTTASLLNYLLWQLGQHPTLQEEIFHEIQESQSDIVTYALNSKAIDRLFAESIRLFTPTYVIGRKPSRNLLCTIRDRSGKLIFQKKIGKNEKLLSMPTLAARNPSLFENPNEFNPHRFKEPLKSYSWLPFGDGAHTCPGQWLAKTEILVTVAMLVQRYQIQSFPKKEFKQLGYITLKPGTEVRLKLNKRL